MPADGAFYLYVDVGEFTADSLAFTKEMLAEIGVAATPGIDFDAERGSRFVRFCYAGTTADMAEAARRLARMEPPQASEVTGGLRRGAAPDLLAGAGEGRALVEQAS